MGFDIMAEDLEGNEVAYHRAYMGGFRMMSEQGYAWFTLIDANDCYGGVSGNGTTKKIQLRNLKYALEILLRHIPIGLANNGFGDEKDLRDEFNDRKPQLKEFMDKCINWCEKNNQEEISIYFG
ncbi:MAG: hypothetical protein IIA87_03265 [Nanoarchaeota archaeon]|nr:hypothetical protein [Nanoarchaeota archaeon]